MSASDRSANADNPVLVELWHGEKIESLHRGSVAIADTAGELLWHAGNLDAPACLRSVLKPMQALALLESGAFDALGLRTEELAIACGSHSGTPRQTGVISDWLRRLDLDPTALGCGNAGPVDRAAALELARSGKSPTALHHNCSGKHAGFLCISKHLGVPSRNYTDPAHPVQQLVLKTISTMLDVPPSALSLNVDGCSAPNIFAPFGTFARAFGRFVDLTDRTPFRVIRERILDAMMRHPDLVSGPGRFSCNLAGVSDGRMIGKSGAEGSYVVLAPQSGFALTMKVDDGAKRACQTFIVDFLRHLPWAAAQKKSDIESLRPAYQSSRGVEIGAFRSASTLAKEAAQAVLHLY